MFRNQYDNDITTWSPQGRLHQVEYAMEAVKQGSATVGAKCKTHTVLVALKRVLARYMRTECMNHRYDQLGPCLYETCPSGQFYNYKAMAIGARAQSAKTYLEKNFEKFENCTVDELVVHCLKALESTCAEGVELSQANTTVAVVGKDTDFTTYDDDDATRWLDLLQKAKDEAAPAPAEPASESSPMEE